MAPPPMLPASAVCPRASRVRRLSPTPQVRRHTSTTPVRRDVQCPGTPLCDSSSPTHFRMRDSYSPKNFRMEPVSRGKTGLLIWFHGMGMSGKEFGEEFDRGIAQRLSWLEFRVPDAPWRPITSGGGQRLRAWFDLLESPINLSMELPGLLEAADRVHDMLREAERSGIPASRIILAGFSQGGVLALQAGLTYSRALAGICAFSSWFPPALKSATLARYKDTPIFMGHGEDDTAVPFDVGMASYEMLKKKRLGRVTFSRYKNFKHWIKEEQLDQLETFALRELPQFPKPIRMPLRIPNKNSTQCSMSVGSTEEGSTSGRSDDDVFVTDDDERMATTSTSLPIAPTPAPASAPAPLQSAPPTPDHRSSFRRGLAPRVARPSHGKDNAYVIRSVQQNTGCASPLAGNRSVNNSPGSVEASIASSFFPLHSSASSIGQEALGVGSFTFGYSRGSTPKSPSVMSPSLRDSLSSVSRSPTRFNASRMSSNRSFTPILSSSTPTWGACFMPV